MADDATIEAIKARAKALLHARAAFVAAGSDHRAAAAGTRQGRAASSSSELELEPPPASPRGVTALLARDDDYAGTPASYERRAGSASPVSRLSIAPAAASSGRSPSGSLNKSLAKVMNPSRTIAERWSRFDAEAGRLEQQVVSVTASGTAVDESVQGDDALDAELEALRAREQALLKRVPERPSVEPVQSPAPDSETSQDEDDIDAELETLRVQERALLEKVAPEREAVDPTVSLPAAGEHGKHAALRDREKLTESSGCCASVRTKKRGMPSSMGTPVPHTSAHQAQADGDLMASDLQIPEYYKWRAPAKHGIVWRVGNFALAVMIGLVLLVLLLAAVALSIPMAVTNLIIGAVMAYGTHFIVNTLYVSRLGIVREWLIRLSRRCCRSCRDHDEHSRPLRVDIELPLHKASATATGRFCSVHTIALFYDNYAYLIVDRSQGDTKPYPCALVDPADADGVMKELERLAVAEYGAKRGAPLELTLQVEAILTTHKHWDHAWGNRKLTDGQTLAHEGSTSRPKVKVYGGKYDDVDCCTDFLDEGETVCAVGSLHFEILHTPCHTAGSIMFLLRGVEGRDVLFTGDSLFVGGVGAHFEGSAEDSEQNMRKVWLNCHPKTLIFAGHEYTLQCLQDRFSCGQIPTGRLQLRRLTTALHRATILRARQLPTVPASLADEIAYNSAFGSLHSSATLLQETWRSFKLLDLARQEADDLGDTRLDRVVPCIKRRSALVPAPRWLRDGQGALVRHSSEFGTDGSTAGHENARVTSGDVDVDDEGWIAGHAQHLWSLGALVEESPGAAAAVGLQLRRQSDQLRASLSNVASLVEAEEALAAEKGDAQQELLQGGGVRFVWGSSLAARQEREHIKSAQGPRHDGTCYRCFRCVCYYCGCCGSSAGTAQDSGSVLTLRAAAKAVSEAADDCISLLAVEPGAPGVTPGASALRRAPADTDRESLRSAVQQLDAACRAMLAIDGAVDQDREEAEDVLRAFMDIGGAEDGTIAVGTLYRALTELGDERTVLLAEDIGEIVQMCKLDIDGGLDSTHPDTSEQLPVRACLLPHPLVCPCGACQQACVPGCADPFL